MTGLRTIWGVSLEKVKTEFGSSYLDYLLQQAEKYISDHLLEVENNILITTKKGKFLSDGIASDLFLLNLN
jgi:oxygen-independent coproporphyrinogen-3 oxidase